MPDRPPIRTPFEMAAFNAQMHPKRMVLCEKINELCEQLVEIQRYTAMVELDVSSPMYCEEIAKIAREEETRIMASLVIIADTWEQIEGVSA